ncbi:M23 family peptidase [Xylanimonas allomyrinae]|uniref:M23 family peptidase n=1 Tax=Xylanimonas allomyrinae TaxID=2509459 RepID=A0A4P6ELW1_9MICO|nr:peptidoglycan DD-metalloendopeptidase family protein [Xylanimonas allomyrinae]QAY62259.1 M23 family peptidase [Xylanimonas allomyrinae]
MERPILRHRAVAAAMLPALVLTPGPRGLPVPTAAPASHVTAATESRAYVPPVPGPVARRFDPPARDWEPGHRGVDLWAAPGATVVAPSGGVVTFAGAVAGKPVVVVTHTDGLRSSLEPVAASVARGTEVAAGEPVGTLEATPGDEANPDHCAALPPAQPPALPPAPPPAHGGDRCVHWGVRRGEMYLDPLSLLGTAAPIVLLPPR